MTRWRKPKRKKTYNRKCPGYILRRAGWATSQMTQVLSETLAAIAAGGSTHSVRVSVPANIWSTVYLTSAQLNILNHYQTYESRAINLTNTPVKLKLYMIRPKFAGSLISTNPLSYAFLDQIWVDSGEATGTWSQFDFDPRDIPHVQELAEVKFVGVTQLEPQTEYTLFKNVQHTRYLSRPVARAYYSHSAGFGIANSQFYAAGETWLLAKIQGPMITGSTATGRSTPVIYIRHLWTEKAWIGNEQVSITQPTSDAQYTGTGRVFNRQYATVADFEAGNTTLA